MREGTHLFLDAGRPKIFASEVEKKTFFVIDAKCTAVVPIKAKPLPKNTNPTHHGGRREARARALNRLLGSEEAVVFTDASKN